MAEGETRSQTDRQSGQGGGGMPVEELGNILQSVMRDQYMKQITKDLIDMKDQEISRLKEIKRDQTSTITRLKEENERMKGQLGDELPILVERSTNLQEKVNTLNERNRQLQERNKTLEANIASMKTSSSQALEKRKILEEQLREKSKDMVTIKAQCEGVKQENMHLKIQLQSTKDDLKLQKEHLEKSEATTAQVKELVDTMFQQKQTLDCQLDESRQKCLQLAEQVKQQEMFENLYFQSCEQIEFYNSTLLPNKDKSIDKLQQKCTDLISEMEVLHRNNIPLDEHIKFLQERLEQTKQALKEYYEKEYGTKLSQMDKQNEAIKRQLDEKETELKNREDVGDELKTSTRTYKNLIKENCDLKDKVKTLETKIRRLSQETLHHKERANELERKISALKITIEE